MNKPIVFILFMMLMGLSFQTQANKPPTVCLDTICLTSSDITCADTLANDFVVPALLQEKKNKKKEKLIAGLLALPFPFGFVGAHRVMLGTKPWIPIVYVATFGGGFGLLPLIDCCVIIFSKDIEQYENNPRLFMWIKPKAESTSGE